MEPEDTNKKSPEERREERGDVTREELYALVWAEPMLKAAAKFEVSSSYMARVCALMNVPRPERGYWAKLAVGKASPKPELAVARPGDQMIWNRSGIPQPSKRPLPRPPAVKPKRKVRPADSQPDIHHLIRGAKGHFEVGRTSYHSQYLRPAKRLLVDLVVSKTGLDKALSFANELFRELEAHDCHVVIAPNGEHMHRAEVDEHEVPRKNPNNYYDYNRLWSPGRITLTYVCIVAIGLTIIELSEQADARYVDGEYVRADQMPPPKRGRYTTDLGWTSKQDFPTGRLCLQAYCTDWRAKWTKQWREDKAKGLSSRIPSIIGELIDATPEIAGLIEEGERKAEIERQKWEAEKLERECREAEERAAKARHDSREELIGIVNAWGQAKRIEEFFGDAEARLDGLDPDRAEALRGRLRRARELVGGIDALARFGRWKAPSERLRHLGQVEPDNDY